MPRAAAVLCAIALLPFADVSSAQTASPRLPPLRPLATAQAVVDEHLDALNKCDWQRLMAQYPDNVEFFLPHGTTVRGREDVGRLFADFVKPREQGGLCGLTFTPEHVFTVDGTVNVQWRATADFLAEPYLGSDAYVTKDGLMWSQVSTFDDTLLKFK